MKRSLILAIAMIAMAAPVLGATPAAKAKAAKPKCPKGEVPLTSTITGDHYCAAISGAMVMGGGPQPILTPQKPAKKTKP